MTEGTSVRKDLIFYTLTLNFTFKTIDELYSYMHYISVLLVLPYIEEERAEQ